MVERNDDMGDIPIIKHALNNTLGTEGFLPLDDFLGAALVLKPGINNVTFEIVNKAGIYPSFTVKVADNLKIVPVPLGEYTVNISTAYGNTKVDISVDTLGKKYIVLYGIKIGEFDAGGTYSIQSSDVRSISVTACGAGGSGGGGAASSGNSGGGGGGGGAAVVDAIFNISPCDSIQCVVGQGGQPVIYRTNGESGGATIIENLVTLAGGGGGSTGYNNVPSNGGTSGGAGGGAGGMGQNSSGATNGENGILGTGGSASAAAGGGGGSLGNGGTGGTSEGIVGSGTRGGGGGGGGRSSSYYSGAGGDGYILIKGGVFE